MRRSTQGYIPKNLGNGTVWDGRFKFRNVIEAAIIVCVIIMLLDPVKRFIPSIIFLSIRLVLCFISGVLALKGIGGEPLSIWFLNVLNYSGTRTYVTLRPPSRDLEDVPKKKSLIFTDDPKEERGRKKKKKASGGKPDVSGEQLPDSAAAETKKERPARSEKKEAKNRAREEKAKLKKEKKEAKRKKKAYAKEQINAKRKNR